MKDSGFGIASLIIGIIALGFSCFGLGVLGIIGILLAIIGLCTKNTDKGAAVEGLITCTVALVISLLFIAGVFSFSNITHYIDNKISKIEKSIDSPKQSDKNTTPPNADNSKKIRTSGKSFNNSAHSNNNTSVKFKENGMISDHIYLRVNKTSTAKEISVSGGKWGVTPLSKKSMFLIANVTVKNSAKDRFILDLYDFNLLSADGTSYMPYMIISSKKNYIICEKMPPQMEITKRIAFEVPKSTKVENLTLCYQDDPTSEVKKFNISEKK